MRRGNVEANSRLNKRTSAGRRFVRKVSWDVTRNLGAELSFLYVISSGGSFAGELRNLDPLVLATAFLLIPEKFFLAALQVLSQVRYRIISIQYHASETPLVASRMWSELHLQQ